jgi:hypothetical protein
MVFHFYRRLYAQRRTVRRAAAVQKEALGGPQA